MTDVFKLCRVEYGINDSVVGAWKWHRLSHPRLPSRIETAARYVGVCRRISRALPPPEEGGLSWLEGEGRVDGRLIAVGFQRVPPMEWIRGLRGEPRRLVDFLSFWDATQGRPETVGSSYNSSPEDAFAFWASGIPMRLARRLPSSSWHAAVGRDGRVRPGRVAALAELSQRITSYATVARISRRRLRALLQFDSETLRAAGAGLTARVDWRRLREADELVREQRSALRATGAPAEDWCLPYAGAIVGLRAAGARVGWTDSRHDGLAEAVEAFGADRIASMWPDIEPHLPTVAEALRTGARPTATAGLVEWAEDTMSSADKLSEAAGCKKVHVHVALGGNTKSFTSSAVVAGGSAIVHAASGTLVHALPGSVVHAAPGAIVRDIGGEIHAAPGAIVVRDDDTLSAEARVALAAIAVQVDVAPVLRGRPLCPAYPNLPLMYSRRLALGETPVQLSHGQLTRREAHEWCLAGCLLRPEVIATPQDWIVRGFGLDLLNGRRPRSVLLARWLVAIHARGAWGQLTRERVMHGPARQTRTVRWIDVLDEIQDVDLVEGARTHVEDAFRRCSERMQRLHASGDPESDVVLTPVPEWAQHLPEGVRVLRTPRQLFREGKELNQCVGSYGYAVANGQCVILSVSAAHARSTAEVAPDGKSVFQHRGAGNADPPRECETLLRRVVG